jgi:hypothetical protein
VSKSNLKISKGFNHSARRWPMKSGYVTLGATICTGASRLLYVFDGAKQLGSQPASSPTKNKKW